LSLQGKTPKHVSQALLNAVPEASPIAVPRVPGAGFPAGDWLPGFRVGSVLRITRASADEYYVVLTAGIQRIGQVAADLLRFRDSQGRATVVAVAPDVIRAAPIVDSLPVSGFPDPAQPEAVGDPTLCATWTPAQSGPADVAFRTGAAPPVPAGQQPVALAQADGHGPAVDAVYLPPGRSAYVASQSLSGDGARTATRYLVTDTGVRFAIHDDDAARHLGLPSVAVSAPWPLLSALPCGPELSREKASVARDAVIAGP
jgi:type VII secretion protein EccB